MATRLHGWALAMIVLSFVGAASAVGSAEKETSPIVTVVRHGGLCVSGHECRSVLRITDSSVVATGYRTRAVSRAQRAALLEAIGTLDLTTLRRHPFTGTCPTASDGSESIYRFRGFPHTLAGCTYDLREVSAVQLTEKLLATLRPR
jgi:hypothetical protein